MKTSEFSEIESGIELEFEECRYFDAAAATEVQGWRVKVHE